MWFRFQTKGSILYKTQLTWSKIQIYLSEKFPIRIHQCSAMILLLEQNVLSSRIFIFKKTKSGKEKNISTSRLNYPTIFSKTTSNQNLWVLTPPRAGKCFPTDLMFHLFHSQGCRIFISNRLLKTWSAEAEESSWDIPENPLKRYPKWWLGKYSLKV